MTRLIGPLVTTALPTPRPEELTLCGQWAQLDPLDVARDAQGLWHVFAGQDWVWDYLFEDPPQDYESFAAILQKVAGLDGQPCYVIRRAGEAEPLGYACFWTVVPAMGSTEIGNVNLSPALQRTPAATEAFFLMINWAFANGYRRMEWKCNALNAPSRAAAQRLGYSFEGVFRQHSVVKGRNRDTAWFAAIDAEWPALKEAFEAWLAPSNFDADGQQVERLGDLTALVRQASDPTL